MNKYLTSNIGRLRVIGFLEGTSYLLLLFIAVPLKYFFDAPILVEILGPIHGFLFVLYIFQSIAAAISYEWTLLGEIWKVFLASVLPFGTFYVDKHIFRKVYLDQK